MLHNSRVKVLLFVIALAIIPANVVSAAPPVHRVIVGSADYCIESPDNPQGNGCGRNFTLVALQDADGNVSGQWDDQAVGSNYHAEVDCLVIDGDHAFVGAVIKHGYYPPIGDLTGWHVYTHVNDGGKEGDQISGTLLWPWARSSCAFGLELFPLTRGQVIIN